MTDVLIYGRDYNKTRPGWVPGASWWGSLVGWGFSPSYCTAQGMVALFPTD